MIGILQGFDVVAFYVFYLVELHCFRGPKAFGFLFRKLSSKNTEVFFLHFRFLPSHILNAEHVKKIFIGPSDWLELTCTHFHNDNMYCHPTEVPVQLRNAIHQSKQLLQLEGEKKSYFWHRNFPHSQNFCDWLKINVHQMSHEDSFVCIILEICATMAQKRSHGKTLHLTRVILDITCLADNTQRYMAFFCKPGPEVIKVFPCSTQLSMKFFLFINVKMPTTVGILRFMCWKNSFLGLSEPEKKLN